ncbi:sensor histidine kinase [Moheibacter stercoris]|uniref:histidine kinase n=1 Tax=Moheibacter stercoris TaxID=1628251 RepID=A0ABV2LQM6_9FLAO
MKNFNLSQRIFLALFLIILLTAVSVLLVTIYNFREQRLKFAEEQLKDKEKAVMASIDYELDRYPELATDENIFHILENSILGIYDIHKININVFDTRGNLFRSTETKGITERVLPQRVMDSLSRNLEYLEVPVESDNGKTYLTTYRYINNYQNQPVAIVNIPYRIDDEMFQDELHNLLRYFMGIMVFVLIFGALFSWIIAKQITGKLSLIASKIKQTDVVIHNRPIEYEQNDEIKPLVDSYNEMLEKLNHQSNLLALTEREEAWREMAKQVAHEIKNPLTPMRMMIQNYVRKYDPNDERAGEKLKDLSDTLVTQIDTMSAIAEAFSDFARMPARKDEVIEIVQTIQTALEIFPDQVIQFKPTIDELHMSFDKIYLIRIVTNLVKNAIQSVPFDREPDIQVHLQKLNNQVIIRISDNGIGIPPHLGDKIFEPKFTTTTGGMGLGLAMVKKIVEDYNGEIRYISEENRGTEFIMKIPYVKNSF